MRVTRVVMSSDDKKPVTIEMMKAYMEILEKDVQQMSLVVKTLEELNDNYKEVNAHFNNGFKSHITDHFDQQMKTVVDKQEKMITTLFIMKEYVERSEQYDKEMINKMGSLKSDIAELKSAIKVERVVNIVGWSVFIMSILTLILRVWGKI